MTPDDRVSIKAVCNILGYSAVAAVALALLVLAVLEIFV